MKDDLEVLINEHQHASEQGRGFWVMLIAVITVGFGSLGGASLLATAESCGRSVSRECVPSGVWAIVPLLPATLTALLLQQIAVQNMNGIYERLLEREIYARAGVSARSVGGRFYGPESLDSIPIPSLGHMIYPLFEPTTKLWRFPFVTYLTGFLFLSMTLLDVAVVLLAYVESASFGWRIVIAVGYGLILVAFVRTAVNITLRQPALWKYAVEQLDLSSSSKQWL